MILKNTYGVSVSIKGELSKFKMENPFTGSSLNRKKNDSRKFVKQENKKIGKVIIDVIPEETINGSIKEKTMSQRTKSKIRVKIIALSQLYTRLSLLTLTFVNSVEDELAIIILRKFIDNMKKTSKDFQYLWVAEKQTKNKFFENNIHFHIITNKFWSMEKHWNYWLKLQRKNGIVPRDENFKPSSAFDVRSIICDNIKGLSNYLTKYVTKNESKLKCQVWNCSKKISALYTGFYSDIEFIENISRTENISIEKIPLEFGTLHLIPLNEQRMNYYNSLKYHNEKIWRK